MELDFSAYESIYPERMDEETFDSFLPSAIMYVNTITVNRAETAIGYKAERVKHAVFAVINEMASQDAARGNGGSRITSVSNEGYSENYGNLSCAASEDAALRSAAFRYLSGTGLVSAL